VTVVKDYLPKRNDINKSVITQFRLANHFAFPLKRQEELSEHDPIAYITGNMTKLSKDELVVFQLVASPVNKSAIPDIKRISHLIYANKDLISGLKAIRAAGLFVGIFKGVIFLGFYVLTLPIGIVVFLASNGREGPLLPLPFGNEPAKTANPYQEELEISIK